MNIEFQAPPDIPTWLKEIYPFRRRVALINGKRIHFVDEGQGTPVLLLHGNPSWSFLWRKVIPLVASEKVRVIAPDMPGLGLSEKLSDPKEYNLEMYVETLSKFVQELDLQHITLGVQDWGGPFGTGMAARNPSRIHSLLIGNTAVLAPKRPLKTTSFHRFSHLPILSELAFCGFNFAVNSMQKVQGDPKSIDPLAKKAYQYPFRTWNSRKVPLILARMVPNTETHPSLKIVDEIDAWIKNFKGPTTLIWGKRDPILGRAIYRHKKALPNATVIETEAGHFLQEEIPELLAEHLLKLLPEI